VGPVKAVDIFGNDTMTIVEVAVGKKIIRDMGCFRF